MTSPAVVATVAELRTILDAHRAAGRSIGTVPTMGALHEGHLALMRAARAACDIVVAWIFVNPTQFAPGEDFDKYPRPLERDIALCGSVGVDLVFAPTPDSIYPPGYQTFVEVPELARKWEGAHRPTHFRGVTTVVLKLLNLIQPHVAYFGQKDYQQQLLIRRMCLDLDLRVRIQTCATVREASGLALSSRNAYLSGAERETALALSRALRNAESRMVSAPDDPAAVRTALQAELRENAGLQLDYAAIVNAYTLEEAATPEEDLVAIVAARVGTTRLIDNRLIPPFSLERLNAAAG